MDVGERQGKAVLKQDSDKGPPRCSNSKVPTTMDGGEQGLTVTAQVDEWILSCIMQVLTVGLTR
jgi:hypothetical protein